MLESQPIHFEADGMVQELDVQVTVVDEDSPFDEERGVREKIDRVQQLIRDYTQYALNAFRNFPSAEVEGVTFKFGIKMGGKAGIPFVTEGTTEGNLEVEVKCKLTGNDNSDFE